MTALHNKWLALSPTVRWPLIILFYLSLIGGYLFRQYQRPGGAALYEHNHTDRPIFSYWVNDKWGGNAGANGGGKITCCWKIQGDTLKIVWIVSRSKAQAEQGLQEERHDLEIPNPPRQRTDDTLHVRFYLTTKFALHGTAALAALWPKKSPNATRGSLNNQPKRCIASPSSEFS